MAPQLPTRKLGKNGPEVTALGFGLMGLSAYYGKPKPDEERYAMLDHVYEAGERFWDSADIYADNEDLLGRWFKRNPGKRENIFLATKFGNFVDPTTGARQVRNEPDYIRAACDKSLRRLGIDQIDLYYCHRVQANQPIEITVKVMKELQDAGKVKYLGLSECSADTLRRACKVVHIDAVQLEYSPFSMDIESPQIGLLKACRELGVAVVAYSPLGRGFLTGGIKSRADFEEGDFRSFAPRFSEENFPKNLKLVEDIKAIADEKGCTPGQLVLAFLMAQGDDIIPIPGTTRVKNFDENMGALNIKITPQDNEKIRKVIDAAEVHGARYPEAFSKALFVDTVPLKE
ncbi:alcohol dehydrogenase [Cladophialophora psammophila CBS 110553]|uniref:Alcohol dehydrogenase n=1 Tax=Cladophialophora psammophila CBS 110553 TaxID=1182543 RepID=W9WYU7_9EURO|nr:alcohol dehydrogenase [Cladophialophora psammophila CBS 110553]EXJ70255.1 alcohol dehydrogenase [Cladophialophora psammophila CBS 110553]